MPNERVIEIPWSLMQLPQTGLILDVGSCETRYLDCIVQADRFLHCLDMNDCSSSIPSEAIFFQQNLIGNSLARHAYDAVLVLSTIEHVGLAHYGGTPMDNGDELALAEVYYLLKPSGRAIFTVPAGYSKVTSWYRQYSPQDLQRLFSGWKTEITYWGYDNNQYVEIAEEAVEAFDYRHVGVGGAGAIAGIVAFPNF